MFVERDQEGKIKGVYQWPQEYAQEEVADDDPDLIAFMERPIEREVSVSRFQARAALHQSGLLPAVQAIMDDPETDPLTVIAWQDAQVFRRNSPTIAAITQQLGLTEDQVDDLFRLAATIEA